MELMPWRRASEPNARQGPTAAEDRRQHATSPKETSPPSEARKTCGTCGASYDGASWTALDSAGRMAAREIAPLVVAWKRARDIDLRKCARCGTVLARLAEFTDEDDDA